MQNQFNLKNSILSADNANTTNLELSKCYLALRSIYTIEDMQNNKIGLPN